MIENLVLAAIAVAVVGLAALAGRIAAARKGGAQAAQRDRDETLFRSMFPELQPHFHPERLVEFVPARLGRGGSATKARWERPAGFAAAAAADLAREGERERVRLLDAAGGLVGEFTFEKHPEGGVLRVGKGKLTVDLRKRGDPRVRYWHPEREFKWSRAGWIFKTPVADEPFASSASRSSSDTSSDTLPAAAAAAGIVGLGGTFDGGGASAGWEGSAAASGAESGDGGSERTSSSDFSGVASGSSSSASSSESSADSGDSGADSGGTSY